jgi:hypothetical protein
MAVTKKITLPAGQNEVFVNIMTHFGVNDALLIQVKALKGKPSFFFQAAGDLSQPAPMLPGSKIPVTTYRSWNVLSVGGKKLEFTKYDQFHLYRGGAGEEELEVEMS